MQKTLVAATVVALIGVAGAANAADVYTSGGLKDGPIFTPATAWTGFYVGLGVGGGIAESDVKINRVDVDSLAGDNILGRAQIGYDRQLGSHYLIGAFFDYDFTDISSKISSPGRSDKIDLTDSWTAGGRIGYLFYPNVLTYVAAGYTEAHFDLPSRFNNNTFSGYTLASGIELPLTGGWFAKGEYRFTQFDKQTIFNSARTTVTDEPRENSIVASIVYKFGGLEGPLAPLK